MKRRTFLKAVSMLPQVPLLGSQAANQQKLSGLDLEKGFLNPPPTARPYTWWHWMNGNVTAEGITLDLEAMKRVGVAGFQIFQVGTGIPKGPVEYGSERHWQLLRHAAREAERLGLAFEMHNCPGWSSSGGPWIPPEYSMQQLVWTESRVQGGRRLQVVLPRPPAMLRYYRDVAVLAFPATQADGPSMKDALVRIRTNRGELAPEQLLAADLDGGFELQPDEVGGERGWVLLEFREPFEVRSIYLWSTAIPSTTSLPGMAGGGLVLEASDDGRSFRQVATLSAPGTGFMGRSLPALSAATFGPVRARYFRLLVPSARRIAQLELSGVARLPDWPRKANYGWGGRLDLQSARTAARHGDEIDPRQVINITGLLRSDGRLEWDAPAGDWVILRIGHTTTGRTNHPGPDGGIGLECDKFNAEAMDYHFHHFFGPLIEVLKPLAEKGLVGALIDSYEVGMQNWTAKFPEEFRKRRGYEVWPYLPAMTGRIVGSVELTERFLWDVRRTQADLMADNYYGRFAELCRRHGWKAYTEPYNGGPFEEMQIGSRVDVPMGEFWHGRGNHRSVKLAASIAHVFGKAIVGAESFTGAPPFSKWQEYPYAMKAEGDWMYTQGLNRYIFHRYAHQPHPSAVPGMTMGPWGIHFDRTNTWFEQSRAWLDYIARCQFLLQQGHFVGDLLYFVGESAPADTPGREQLVPPPPKGYDWDTVNAEALLKRVQVRDGKIQLPDGTSYWLMVLTPEARLMTVPVLEKLLQLVREGLWVVGPRPEVNPSLSGYPASDRDFEKLVQELWGDLNDEARGDRKVGRGRVIWGMPLERILSELGVPPDFELIAAQPDADINAIHRRAGEIDIYFVANRRRRPEDVLCAFRVRDKQPELWDPVTGSIREAPCFEVVDGRTRIPLQLGPAGSIFVVFRGKSERAGLRAIYVNGQAIVHTRASQELEDRSRQSTPVNNFSLVAWVKPEVEVPLPVEGTRLGFLSQPSSFLVYPTEGEVIFGKGHACAGLMVGRNGVAVFESARGTPAPVLVVPVPLAGWSHLALTYEDGTPSLYVNGKRVARGKRSDYEVHLPVGLRLMRSDTPHFEGEYAGLNALSEVLGESEIQKLYGQGLPEPLKPRLVELVGPSRGFLVWHGGEYVLENTRGERHLLRVEPLPEPMPVEGPWIVRFQPERGAPKEIVLPQLMSLHRHSDPGVRYFSGTAAYLTNIHIPHDRFKEEWRIFIDLGRVEVLAEVVVNGKSLGLYWLPPYWVDVTQAVRAGENQLEVRVTNLWVNRLIGDEQLPPENEYEESPLLRRAFGAAIRKLPDWYLEGRPKPPGGRITFTTWKHFDRNSPLVESGLLGPVKLRWARVYRSGV